MIGFIMTTSQNRSISMYHQTQKDASKAARIQFILQVQMYGTQG
jgi:hypothetical protein